MSANINIKYLLAGRDNHYISYVLKDQVCRYLYDIRYEAQLRESKDEKEIKTLLTCDPELLYLSFRETLVELSANQEELQSYIQSVIALTLLKKVYQSETCVVCYDNRPEIILDCNHLSTCEKCYDALKKNVCPLCRKQVTFAFKRTKFD